MFGERIYVVMSPEDVTMVYKNTAGFSWDAYMDRLLESFGLNQSAREVSWRNPSFEDVGDGRMSTINP